ncbi:MAG: (2Fe-2S)-binding protein [Elusimicrobiota bacterium]
MIKFKINNAEMAFSGPPFTRLIDVLRRNFGLTGTKEGCGEGECGACTILVDGEAVNSCLIPISQVEGKSVETIESIGTPKNLSRLQESFHREGGSQCGICTPGMIMSAESHLRGGGSADRGEIRKCLSGNLCRCTGYQHIVNSVAKAAQKKGKKK